MSNRAASSKSLFDTLYSSFSSGKNAPKWAREEFCRLYEPASETKRLSLDEIFGPLFPKGKHISRAKNNQGVEVKCLGEIAKMLNSDRNCTVIHAIEAVAGKYKVGIDTVKVWWAKASTNEAADRRETGLLDIIYQVHMAKNRYRKSEYKEQPLRKNAEGRIILDSLRLVPKRK